MRDSGSQRGDDRPDGEERDSRRPGGGGTGQGQGLEGRKGRRPPDPAASPPRPPPPGLRPTLDREMEKVSL